MSSSVRQLLGAIGQKLPDAWLMFLVSGLLFLGSGALEAWAGTQSLPVIGRLVMGVIGIGLAYHCWRQDMASIQNAKSGQ